MHQLTTNPGPNSINRRHGAAAAPRRSTLLELVFELATDPGLRRRDIAALAAAEVASGAVELTGNYAGATWA